MDAKLPMECRTNECVEFFSIEVNPTNQTETANIENILKDSNLQKKFYRIQSYKSSDQHRKIPKGSNLLKFLRKILRIKEALSGEKHQAQNNCRTNQHYTDQHRKLPSR